MRALCQSTWCRFVLLLTLAAFVAAGAAVPVGAVEQSFDYPVSLYSYSSLVNPSPTFRTIGDDFSTTATATKAFGPMVEFQHNADTSYVVVVTLNQSSAINSLLYSNNLLMAQLNSGEAASIQFPGNIQEISTLQLDLQQNSATYVITYNTSSIEYADTIDRLYFAWQTNFGSSTSTFRITIASATAYAIYDPPGTTLEDIEIKINEIITQNQTNSENLQSKIDELIKNQNNSNANIEGALEDIKDNQVIEQNYWQTILNYGSDYNQIDQTTINNFGTAQDNLSSAEGALQDKSQSLRDGVSSQWQNNINTTKNFVGTITPATTAITSTITQIVAVMPEEVQALLVVIPLLLFIGWLIGRIEGG